MDDSPMLSSTGVVLSAIPAANLATRAIGNVTTFTQNSFANLFKNSDTSEPDASVTEAKSLEKIDTPDRQFLSGPANGYLLRFESHRNRIPAKEKASAARQTKSLKT